MEKSLSGFNYDLSKWKLVYDRYSNLYLVRLSDLNNQYNLGCKRNIRALKQISENQFIILEGYPSRKIHYLRLYNITDDDIIEVSSTSYYTTCKFWTDTVVLLDGYIVYDLQKDKTIDGYTSALEYLYDNNFYDTIFLQKDEHYYLFCTAEITSSYGGSKEYLQLVLDIENCKTVLPVYSSLRDELIDITETFTLSDLLREELNHKKIVDANMANITFSTGKKILLSAFENI